MSFRSCGIDSLNVVIAEYPAKKLPGRRLPWRGKEFLCRTRLFKPAFVNKDHSMADMSCETHLVGDDEHRHVLSCQFRHEVEDLSDEFGVEGLMSPHRTA